MAVLNQKTFEKINLIRDQSSEHSHRILFENFERWYLTRRTAYAVGTEQSTNQSAVSATPTSPFKIT